MNLGDKFEHEDIRFYKYVAIFGVAIMLIAITLTW